jgi:hypothetical protein
MNLSSEGVIDLMSGEGPLCPNSMLLPIHPSHEMHVRVANAVYEAIPRDADGEPTTPELAKVNSAASYGSDVNARMRLYRNVVSAMQGSRPVAVEALFFRCGICGLTLPASRAPERQ